ncbi:MAG: hypothetical protein Q4F95_02095 [Oscillospiraceae bacterium]|nr:hypothetical protein [Oscillospiraceae bacterium]
MLTTKKKNKNHMDEKIHALFSNFDLCIRNKYPVKSTIVYIYSDTDAEFRRLYGGTLESKMILEKYLSYTNTTILVNPTGLKENLMYKSRLITQIHISDKVFLIILSSYNFEAFRYVSQDIITEILKIEKAGETI